MRSIRSYQHFTFTDWQAAAELFSDPNEYRYYIECFTKRLIVESRVHFSVNQDSRTRKPALHASILGDYLLNILINPLVVNKTLKYQNERNPYVQVTLKNIEWFELERFPLMLSTTSESELLRWVKVLNNCVVKIRYDINNPDIQEKLTIHQELECINYVNLIKHIQLVYQKKPRFALFTASFTSHADRPYVPIHSNNEHVDYQKAIKIIESIIQSFSSAPWSHAYVDSAWKLNYFYRDRLCFDVLIFLEDIKYYSEGVIDFLLASDWREETGGFGDFKGSCLCGNVLTPTGESFCSDASVMTVVKEMTSLTHSVLEMANDQGVTQGIGSLTLTT